MNLKNTHQIWEITILTPLHIGDGDEMQQNIDFIGSRGRIEVIDINAVFDALRDNPMAISEIGQIYFNLEKFARDYKIPLSSVYSLKFGSGKVPGSIRRFIKDAYGRPYLPGSTLKGSIRTALQAGFNRSRMPDPSTYKYFRNAVKNLDGKNPHHDFIRPLSLSDSESLEPIQVLEANEIKIFNLMNGNKPGWKDFSKKQNLENHQQVTGIYVENLKPGTKLHVQIGLDQFLIQSSLRKIAELPHSGGLDGFDKLSVAVNRHSLKIAEAEQTFFSRFKPATAPAEAAWKNIADGIREAIDQPDSPIFLRLAWGSGWRGMTGNWLEGPKLATVRQQKNLGKKGVETFPKTRRLALKDGIPCIPMGWVQMIPLAGDQFFDHISFSTDSVQSGDKKELKVSEQEKLSPETYHESKRKPPPTPKTVPVENAEKDNEVIPPPIETWENAHLKWYPNNDTIVATHQNLKATTTGKELVPEKYYKKLIKKKKAIVGTVEVVPYGNALTINKIE